MEKLNLQSFIGAGPDTESNQYRVLNNLKPYYHEFSHNRLYPALSELIDLVKTLDALVDTHTNLRSQMPHRVKRVDLNNKRIVYEPSSLPVTALEGIIELIVWALPHIKEAIEEGMRMYDFVEANLGIEEVGLLPMYKDEGYYFIPDNKTSLLHLLRYETSWLTSETEKFRTLRTRMLDSIKQTVVCRSLQSIKLDLIELHQDLPNPATFVCETELDFPYTETILPIAKRKLLARLYS